MSVYVVEVCIVKYDLLGKILILSGSFCGWNNSFFLKGV